MALEQVPRALVKACVKRYGTYLQRYPVPIRQERLQLLSRWEPIRPVVEEVHQELYPAAPVTIAPSPTPINAYTAGVTYPRYACKQGNPLGCELTRSAPLPEPWITHCSVCNFPALLPEKVELRGQRGSYVIERSLGQRGAGRLYAATQTGFNQSVVVKEYLLPQSYFNAAERQQQQKVFRNLAGFSLADGRIQDFRFVQPLEAIANDLDERCYLITDERDACPTLRRYLTQGPLTSAEVRWVLNQVLQTLEFLHGQRFRLPSGQMQTGMVHGNLSLDSLLIGIQQPEVAIQDGSVAPSRLLDSDCFIYLCDLALWEQLFDPAAINAAPKSFAQDLVDLGYIAFYLLVGREVVPTGEPLDPRDPQHWQVVDPFLKQFILRLMGLELPFENAEVARRELLRSPQLTFAPRLEPEPAPATSAKQTIPRFLIFLFSLLGLGALGWLIWTLLPKPQATTAIAPPLCCLKDVAGIPPGRFTYTSTEAGTWNYIFQTPDLIQKGQTLEQRLKEAQPNLQLQFRSSHSPTSAIAQVQSGKAAFAIVPLIEPLPNDLEATTIAYDGLVFVIPFSYSKREQGLPAQLHGRLTVKQLQQLYTGRVENWRDLGGSALPVNLYLPENQEAIAVFQQRVLKENSGERMGYRSEPIPTLPEFELLRTIIQDFESRQVGGIGFSSLSKVVGQCSVYPLAIQTQTQPAVQPVVLSDGKPIEPTTDLCDKKGSYHLSVASLKAGRYPLSYPIAIVYSRNNDRPAIGEKFAELFKTREGQKLLSQTGLVPLNQD
jgi:hypothetical protein